VYVRSDGSPQWQCVHLRGPSLANLSALPFVARGLARAQAAVALDSLDVSMSEAER
jgi:NADH:ubiquinone oxidoreductase subunit D